MPKRMVKQPRSKMALFGSNQPSTNQPSTSLFGNPVNTATQPQNNSFSKPLGGSLFSNTSNANANPQSSSGLFSNNTPAQTQQPAASNNVFGSALPSTQPQQQASGASLFGNLGAQQQQQSTGSLFGNTTSQAGQGNSNIPASSSLFGTTQANQAPQLGTIVDGQSSQAAAAPSTTTALFQNLLERGKSRQQRSNADNQLRELPSIRLGLSDIASKVRDLGNTAAVPSGTNASYNRAHHLLAASGVPRASILRDLDDFNAQDAMPNSPTVPQPLDTDIDAYVNSLQVRSSAELFQEYMAQSKRDFDAFVEDRFQMDQSEQRRRIYEHFGLSRPDERAGTPRGETFRETRRGAFGKSSRANDSTFGGQNDYTQSSIGSQLLSRSVLGRAVGKGSFGSSLFADTAERFGTKAMGISLDDPSIRNKQEKYASKVKALNLARLQEDTYPVIEEFARVEIESGDDTPQHLVDAYRALKRITGEHPIAQQSSDAAAPRERQFATNYLDTADSGRGLEMKKRILGGSKAYLEDSFFATIESVVSRNPREASLGGVPSKINKVRAYVRVRALRKDLGTEEDTLQKVGDDLCWVLIFFLLRAGLVLEAAQYVSEHEKELRIMDRGFPVYMALYANDPNRRLSPDMERRMDVEYQARRKNSPENSLDPYRMACYKIIGRCDLMQKTLDGVSTGLEDWMWVTLSLAREMPRTEETAGRSFSLEDVRSTITQIGQKHFATMDDNTSGYATYFYLQVLAGMFERAVAWLQPYNYTVAVHFAIALDFYGLLRVSDFSPTETRLLTESTSQQPQIDFERLLGYYTQNFRLARAAEACEYLTLICLNSDLPGVGGAAHVSNCHEALKELVLETREFALLLGDVRADGRRVAGLIEQRVKLISAEDQTDFLKSLTVQAAAVADDSGRVTDAVLLYHLAEEFDNVIVVINRALSEAVCMELGRERIHLQSPAMRNQQGSQQQQQQNQQRQEGSESMSLTSIDDPLVLAKHIISLYNESAMYFRKIRQTNREACGILIRMSEARQRVADGKWAEAVDIITSLDLLPLRAKGNVSVVRSASQAFNSLPQVVTKTIGNMLTWTINCLGKQREAIKNSAFQAQRPLADELLVKAKDLMVFAGLIRYKLPPDVFETLAVGVY